MVDTPSRLTAGKLWHWKFDDNGERRYLVYTGRQKLYVQIQLISVEHVKFKARCDALTADLSLLFDGDDTKVDELLARHKIPVRSIPYNELDRIELLPFLEKQVRIRYGDRGKRRKAKLRFGGGMTAEALYEELRAAISPAAGIESEEMDVLTAILGPSLATLGCLLMGWLFYTLSVEEYRGFSGLGKVIEKFGHAVGPVPIIIVTVIAVGICVWILTSRIRKRPTISFWKFREA